MLKNEEIGSKKVESMKERLGRAVKTGDLETIAELFEMKSLVDAQDVHGRTALHYAVMSPDCATDAIDALLGAGADIELKDRNDQAAPEYASENGNSDAEELILKSRGSSSLHHAAERGDIETMTALLDAGIDIEIRDNKRLTPLIYAVCAKNSESVRFLLESGAKIDIDNIFDMSPLHAATVFDEIEILKLLLDYDGDVNLKGLKGLTPLHCAIKSNNANAVKLLIERGADVHAVYDKGCTPMHVVAMFANAEIGTLLLEAGGEIDVCNDAGRTPLHYAANEIPLVKPEVSIVNRSKRLFSKLR